MFFFHDLETRKKNTNYIVKSATDFSNIFTSNKKASGIFLSTIHITVTIMAGLYLIFSTKIDYLFYACLLLWISICTLHFYFNGCIVIRIERELLDDKQWYAGWTPLFILAEKQFNRKIPTKLANNIFICVGILIWSIIFLKFLYY